MQKEIDVIDEKALTEHKGLDDDKTKADKVERYSFFNRRTAQTLISVAKYM